MTATSMNRIVASSLALVACGAIALFYGVQHFGHEPPAEASATGAAPMPAAPAQGAQDASSAPLASAQAQANALAAALTPSPPPDATDGAPSFDVARVEPTGDAVIAGRAAPGATVELLRDGQPLDRAVADQSGQFVMVPARLPAGSYELTLRSRQADGREAASKQSVKVALEANPQQNPVVALMTPDKTTAVPAAAAAVNPAGGELAVEAVETEPGGKLHVRGHALPGASVRLSLNDSFLASGTAAADGRFSFTVDGGVKPGNYHVRLDEVASNTVRSHADVALNVAEKSAVTGSVPEQAASSERNGSSPSPQPNIASATAAASTDAASPDKGSPSSVVVPGIATTTVSRGDSLWRISRVSYGAGTRYAVIYKANRKLIRNPNLIYPGQIFVVPAKGH
jgi:nucleoid-associated protein YgaU